MTFNKSKIAFVFLVTVGCLQAVADVLQLSTLKAIGLATSASPAPKVFTAQGDFETYANNFYIEYINLENISIQIHITPAVYKKLKGPYNRRNMYGAATSYAPVLKANSHTEAMLDSVIQYSFCGEGMLLQEFGVTDAMPNAPIRMILEPIGSDADKYSEPVVFEVICDE